MSASSNATPNHSLTNTLISAAEKLDWTCEWEEYANDTYIRFGKYSPAGEDFSVFVSVGHIVEEVWDIANSFNLDEHVSIWLDAAHHGTGGVPSAKILVEDAEQIETMLQELAEALEKAQKKYERSSPNAKLTNAVTRSANQETADKSTAKEPTR